MYQLGIGKIVIGNLTESFDLSLSVFSELLLPDELGLTDNLQYFSCMTMSNEDAIKVKEILLEALKKSHDLVRKSNDEDIFGFNLDFFKL